ncbi:MAG: molybdopterin-dependent oxidoreductase [Roseobacter sp.]
MPVTWYCALEIAAEVNKHVLEEHGTNAYGLKTFSSGYMENTYAITKYALRNVRTANFTFHDAPSDVMSTPSFWDAGLESFGSSYGDVAEADCRLMCGTYPYESKTILFMDFIMSAIQDGQKSIFLVPRKTAGVAYAEQTRSMCIDTQLGTGLPVVPAIARVIDENGWQHDEWIEK